MTASVLPLMLSLDTSVSAAEEAQMSIPDCISLALRENRTIKNAYLDRVAQKYDLRVAEYKFIPKMQLSPSIQASRGTGSSFAQSTAVSNVAATVTEQLPTGALITLKGNQNITNIKGDTPNRAYGWSIDFSQPLLKGGGIAVNTASVRTARLNEQSNIISLKTTIMDTMVSIITAYRNYVQTIKALEISRQSLERSKELVATNRELIAAGRMAAIEIVQSEADVASKEYNLLSAENAVDAARLALTKAIDIDKNTKISPVSKVDIVPVPYNFEEAKKLAFENRPDYLTSLLGYESSKIQLAVAKNSTLWDLALTGGYSQAYTRDSSTDGINTFGGAWSGGLKLTIPINDPAVYQSYVTADVALKKTENLLARQRINIEIEVQDALRVADMNYRQIKLATQSRVLSEKKVEVETEKLKAGRSTNFQLVSYQNDLVNAQNGELNAIITYLNALTALERTLGITLDTLKISLVER